VSTDLRTTGSDKAYLVGWHQGDNNVRAQAHLGHIPAFNPYSRLRGKQVNLAAHAQVLAAVRRRRRRFVEGLGQGHDKRKSDLLRQPPLMTFFFAKLSATGPLISKK
jgi:hypothetical protein